MTILNNSINNPIELIVFDIAGTTVKDNGEVARAFQSALNEHNYNVLLLKLTRLLRDKKTEAIKQMLTDYEPQKDKITEDYINKISQRFLDND